MNKIITLTIAALISLNACSSKPKVQTDEGVIPTAANADENTMGDSDSGQAMGLQTIHFGYDSYTLDDANKAQLQANAQILKDKPTIKIQVEGHCDARGGIQYNLALGEKRANAVKKFLQDQGIAADRLSVISFGKEKLLDTAESESAHAKNRRGTFVITAR
jgi:peptidoglycan-associated lipoprotein